MHVQGDHTVELVMVVPHNEPVEPLEPEDHEHPTEEPPEQESYSCLRHAQ